MEGAVVEKSFSEIEFFRSEKVSKILLKIAPPIMLAQLIQALYNIVDSLFVGRYAESGLTALSVIYPVQLLMIALAVGTGVGINTVMAARFGVGERKDAERFAGVGTPLATALWFLFAAISWAIMPTYARMSTGSEAVARDVVTYGRIVCVFSLGLFLESVWTKVIQAGGDTKTPMYAQILGAVTNLLLDPLLIFGLAGLPELGIAGAAVATVGGQIVAAMVVARKGFWRPPVLSVYPRYIAQIFRLGLPNMLMQSAYTFYILGLNLILAAFSDQAVTALGLYYKWQTFFFIPLNAMQTCIVPIISFNYAAKNLERCKKVLSTAILFGMALMAVGILCFEWAPAQMLHVFTSDPQVVAIGRVGFRIIGLSFLPLVTSLIFPVFFQAVGEGIKSSLLTVVRTAVLFVPLGFLFSRFGLDWFWLTFPVTECVTTLVGVLFYRRFLKEQRFVFQPPQTVGRTVLHPSHPGVIIAISREHGSGGKQIGKMVAARLDIPFYYKEMTALAAQESGLDKEFVSDINKNQPRVFYDLYLSTHVVRHAVKAQYQIIRKIAELGSCVIVGRAADHVLRDHPNLVRVFIYAPEAFRVEKVMKVYGDTREQARKSIRRSDKARGRYYHSISGRKWGDRRNYDLMIDSSRGEEWAADAIVHYITKEASISS